MLEAQDVRVDPVERRAWRGAEELFFSRKEFDLVLALISRAGDVVSREDLMRDVWNTTFWTSSKTIDVHLGWVRRKLGDDPRNPTLITTLRGRGLRFELVAPVVPAIELPVAPVVAAVELPVAPVVPAVELPVAPVVPAVERPVAPTADAGA